MAGYRNTFFNLLRQSGVRLPVRWLAAWSGQRFILPLYHTVADEPPVHIRHLYPVKTCRQFSADLDFLLKHYRPIDLPALEKLLHQGVPPAFNSFLMTFDDGLREFHDVVAPILLQKGIPAICFLNSNFVDNKGLFFRYKASLLLDFFEYHPEALQHPTVKKYTNLPGPMPTEIRTVLLHVRYQTQAILDDLATAVGLDFSQYLKAQRPYLDSAQINSLITQGFYFGAHSCDHPEYRFLPPPEQIRQTAESVAAICQRFELPYRTFAFPFTDYEVSKAVFQEMYDGKAAVSASFGCAGMKRDEFPQHFQRIPFETDDLDAAEILHNEYLYFLLKTLAGKNRIRRT